MISHAAASGFQGSKVLFGRPGSGVRSHLPIIMAAWRTEGGARNGALINSGKKAACLIRQAFGEEIIPDRPARGMLQFGAKPGGAYERVSSK